MHFTPTELSEFQGVPAIDVLTDHIGILGGLMFGLPFLLTLIFVIAFITAIRTGHPKGKIVWGFLVINTLNYPILAFTTVGVFLYKLSPIVYLVSVGYSMVSFSPIYAIF